MKGEHFNDLLGKTVAKMCQETSLSWEKALLVALPRGSVAREQAPLEHT